MPQEARKHHYVPRAVLRNFALVPGGDQVFAFDKKTAQQFKVAVGDAAAERDFNRVIIGQREINYEFLFQEIDSRLAAAIRALTETRTLLGVSEDVLRDLPVLLACQLVRTRIIRTSPIEFSKQLSEWMESLEFEPTRVIDDADARRISLGQLFELDRFAEIMRRKDPVLLISSQPACGFRTTQW